MRCRVPIFAIALCLLSALACAGEPTAEQPTAGEPPLEVKTYIDFLDKNRSGRVGDLKDGMRSARGKELALIKKELREVVNGADYEMNLTGKLTRGGDFGKLGLCDAKVIQVMTDQDAALVELEFTSTYMAIGGVPGANFPKTGGSTARKLVWVEGADAKKYADGESFVSDHVFHVAGTNQYQNVDEATETVLLLKAFDMESFNEWRKDHPPKKIKPQKRRK